LFISPCATRVL